MDGSTGDAALPPDKEDLGPGGDMPPPQVDMDRVRRDMPISGFDFGGGGDMTLAPLMLTNLTPGQGSVRGGQRVRIDGAGLTQETQVLFDNVPLDVTFVAGSLLALTPPVDSPGSVSVKALREDGQSAVLPQGYRYVDDLAITSVSPNAVPTRGGVEVDVRGTGFDPDRTVVTLGNKGVARVNVIDSTLMRVLTAPHPKGVVDLRVVTPNGRATKKDALRFFVSLGLQTVLPAAGPTAGGTLVTVRGEGFDAQTKVLFDGVSAAVVSRDVQTGQIVVTTPPHAPGPVPVTVVTGLESAVKIDGFFYTDDATPRILAASPPRGDLAGGETVLLTGVGLGQAQDAIVFGQKPAMVLERQDTWARVQSPRADTPGPVDLTLTRGPTTLAALPNGFTYLALPTLATVAPAQGPSAGGQSVVLTGERLGAVEQVLMGGVGAGIVSREATRLEVVSPARVAGLVDVVLVQGESQVVKTDAYTYVDALEVWGFSPTRGALAGGTHVEVFGRGFGSIVGVTLGGVEADKVVRIDDNTLTLLTPPSSQALTHEVALGVRTQGGGGLDGPYLYQYYNPASRFGGASGGAVQGAVNVSVFASGGSPIPQAFVMLSTRPDTKYQGWTNEFGQITLSGPEVLGSQTVSATAAGFSAATFRAVDAEDITIFLDRTVLTPNPGGGGGATPAPLATITGRVKMSAKISGATQSSFKMAAVATTSLSTRGGNPEPGEGSVVFGEGEYRIRSRIGDLAVVALCGVYDNTTQRFDPQFMGVKRYLSVADKQTVRADVLCDIPLDKNLGVKLVNPAYAPAGPNSNVAKVVWDFGFEGYFASPVVATGLGDTLQVRRLPALAGELGDIDFTVVAGSYTDLFAPFTETSRLDVTALGTTLLMPPLLDVPEAISPQPGGTVVNRQIRWQASGAYPPDLVFLILRNAQGLPVWTITVPGSQTSVTLPEFPDFSGQPLAQRPEPYASGPLFLSITAVRIPQFDYDQVTYEDLSSSRWEARAVTGWPLTLKK